MSYKTILDSGVNAIGYTIVRVAPVAAPLPALTKLLDAQGYSMAAWFTVFGIEIIGYAIGELAVQFVRRNLATWKQAALPLAIYSAVIEGLLIGYVVAPAIADYNAGAIDAGLLIQACVAILYPFFTLSGAALFALHQYLANIDESEAYDRQLERERENERYRLEVDREQREWEAKQRQKERDHEAKLAVKLAKVEGVKLHPVRSDATTSDEDVTSQGSTPDVTPKVTPEDRRVILLDVLRSEYDGQPADVLNKSELARRFDVSRVTINNDIKALQSDGHLSLNGHVVVGEV